MSIDIAAIKARADIDELAYDFWSIHPRELDAWYKGDMPKDYKGGVRAWYFASKIRAALEASEAARVKAEMERDALKEALKMPDADRRQWLLSELVATKGYFNRVDLCEAFGISIPQASTDIRRFLTVFPGLVEYDKTAKRYTRRALEASK